jgi:signal transduction histidine kinase/HD-like signal output (HDOD) protein
LTFKELASNDDKVKKTNGKWTNRVKDAKTIHGRLKFSKSLPSPPQILLKLLDVCGNSKATPKELADIVFKDPSISAKILQLINSSFMGLREKVNDLEKAVVYLGADAIKNIAVSASVVQVFQRLGSSAQFNMHHFWWHSFMCATLAKRIAQKVKYTPPDEAFLSGMLHDIGKLVLWVNFKDKYTEALREAGDDSNLLIMKESEIGATHHELGAWMVQQWQLNSLMADAIFYHHDALERVAEALPLVKIVYLANVFSRLDNGDQAEMRTAARALFDLTDEQIHDILANARDETRDVAKDLGIPATPPQPAEPAPSPETDTLHDNRLADTVKHLSLMYGTIQNLLKADSPQKILKTATQGLGILFGIQQFILFVHDPENDALRVQGASAAFGKGATANLVLPVAGGQSLLTHCFQAKKRFDTFRLPKGLALSIADEQILRLLGTDGMICLPMTADNTSVGLIVAGVSAGHAGEISRQQKLLDLFVSHTGMCLYVHGIKRAQTRRLHDERIEASVTMARKVVHEVNNPLGIIKNYLKILGLKLPEKHPAQAELGVIGEEIDRVGQIIRGLKNFSAPAAEALEVLDINRLLKDILAIVDSSLLKPAMIHLDFTPDPTVPGIRTGKNSLKQVVINLVKNAAEAMSEGGNISISTQFHDATGQDPGAGRTLPERVDILIRDDGPGIPENIRQHLFEPFHSTKKAGHSGLGLSIVHNIISRLGGQILCETAPQSGTTFKITLPATSEERLDTQGG